MSSAHGDLAIDAGARGAVHDARGRAGVLLLILSEISFFSVFLVAYLFYIGRSLNGPYPAELLEFPVLGTICLLGSSGTIMLATRALGANAIGRFRVFLFVTFALGASFLVLTALEWQHLIQNGLTIRTNLFGTTYYSLVGFHAAHVTLGVGIMGLLLVLSSRGDITRAHTERVELFSWYWHFVDSVWIAVVAVVYVIGV
jgi:cytochrome c oxidase subunit 3/cytochrome o ubiquinol oxidase subunit 3